MVLDNIKQIGSLFQMGTLSVGLDVGSSSVKVVALKKSTSGNPKVFGIGYYEVPQGCVVDGIINDSKTMEEILKQALADAGLTTTGVKANVALGGLNVIYKNLELSDAGPDELQEQILTEAQQLVDSDLTDWIVDFQKVGEPNPEGQIRVLLVAAKRSGAEELGQTLVNCGIAPGVFDADILSFQNLVEKTAPEFLVGNTLLVDIGRDTTKINLLENGVTSLVRGVSFGGAALTENLTRQLNIDSEEAESIKFSLSQSAELQGQAEIKEAVGEFIEEVQHEINTTLEFFGGTSGPQIDRILLAGGASGTGGLLEELHQRLNTDVLFIDPFSTMSVPRTYQERIMHFPQIFAVATGLAFRKTGDKS